MSGYRGRHSPACTQRRGQHVRMGLDAELSRDSRPLDHAGEAGSGQRRATLRYEHE
jgi:hypothetical protein